MSRFEAARDAQEPVAGIWSVSVKPTDIFKTGTAEMLVLLLLWEGDCHGYDLSQRLRDRSGGLLTAQDGSLYPVLRRLESGKACIRELREVNRTLFEGIRCVTEKEMGTDEDTSDA